MTTEPMCRSVSSFTAAARSAVGSIVTTLPPLAARIVLTFISSLLRSGLRKRPAIPCMGNDPPRGWFRQDAMQCEKTAPVCTENLYPDVVVMKSAKDGVRIDASGPLNGARDRRIFIQ